MGTENENLNYLTKLDSQVRAVERVRLKSGGVLRRAGLVPPPEYVFHDIFKERSMSSKEMERVLDIVRDEDLVFRPAISNHFFEKSYEVMEATKPYPGVRSYTRILLRFSERQVPTEYDWNRLSEHFLSQRNLRLIDFHGLEPIFENKSHYEY
jgi:hypothetical protein